ncbi:hypothetical protein EJ110_NYTH09721 [Nymphaea thermarum]|nr:hypothetical protein EJ110_NYTH09721 [Nymphaea thermarum]
MDGSRLEITFLAKGGTPDSYVASVVSITQTWLQRPFVDHSLLLLSLFFLSVTVTKCSSPDLSALREFRVFLDPSNLLTSWDVGDPCSGKWLGITCKSRSVAHLVLQGLRPSASLVPFSH